LEKLTQEKFEKEIKEQINSWLLASNVPKGIKFDEAKKLKDKEDEAQLEMIKEVFDFWKAVETKRESGKKLLLWGFGALSIVQTIFIMVIVIWSAIDYNFIISENVFISVIFGTLVQIIGVVMVITKSLFDNKNDKIMSFISQWIRRR